MRIKNPKLTITFINNTSRTILVFNNVINDSNNLTNSPKNIGSGETFVVEHIVIPYDNVFNYYISNNI